MLTWRRMSVASEECLPTLATHKLCALAILSSTTTLEAPPTRRICMTLPPVFTDPLFYVFYAAIGVSAASEFLGRRQYRADPAERDDRGSYRVLQVAVFAALLVGLGAAYAVEATAIQPALPAFWAGIVLILVGTLVRRIAMSTLDQHFSYHVSVRSDHDVVDDGVYGVVRHPSYTGGTIGYLGIGFALGDWIAVLALALACAVSYGYRIRVEEAVLRENLGDAYEAYEERTPYRLVPWVW